MCAKQDSLKINLSVFFGEDAELYNEDGVVEVTSSLPPRTDPRPSIWKDEWLLIFP